VWRCPLATVPVHALQLLLELVIEDPVAVLSRNPKSVVRAPAASSELLLLVQLDPGFSIAASSLCLRDGPDHERWLVSIFLPRKFGMGRIGAGFNLVGALAGWVGGRRLVSASALLTDHFGVSFITVPLVELVQYTLVSSTAMEPGPPWRTRAGSGCGCCLPRHIS